MIDGVSKEMELAVQAKFDSWDSIVNNNILETGTEEQIRKVYSLLRDPTIYSYAFFRLPDGSPFKLYPYQDAMLNDPSKRVIFGAANQIGKSIALILKAVTFALMNPGTTTLLVSKTLPQSKDLLLQIKNLLMYSTLDYKDMVGESETKTEIYFKHFDTDKNGKKKELMQSRIICVPCTGSALGYAVDLMLLDELAFFDDGEYFYKQIAQPRTYTTKGQIIAFSNPNGQQGIFWELWNSKRFSKYRFTFMDCPTNTKQEFEELCEGLTQEQIDSTLLARFTSPEGGFLTLHERRAIQEERMNILPSAITTPLYIFYDFAKSMDRTVRCIGIPMEKDGKAGVWIYEMKEYASGTSYSDIVEELELLIKEVGPGMVDMVGWDNTGVGRGIEDFIKKIATMGVMCTPVEFSLQNKSAIYTNFKLLVEKTARGEFGLSIPFIKACDEQLSKLRFKKSQGRGYLQVHHERESDRDDFPDSICGLCSLIIQPGSAPVTMEVMGSDNKYDATIDRCECGNWIEVGDVSCSFCGKNWED